MSTILERREPVYVWRSAPTRCIDHTLRSIRSSTHLNPFSPFPPRCQLIEMFGDYPFDLPCFNCSGCLSLDRYFLLCKSELIFHLRSRYPCLPDCCAAKAFDTFKRMVEYALSNHRCPRLLLGKRVDWSTTVTTQVTRIYLDPPRLITNDVPVLDRVIQESFQEAALVRPATKDSVRALFIARDDCNDDSFESCDPCAICFEEMETRKTTLTMPCSHMFHQNCLLKWLDNRNFCPLCRYQMPVAVSH